MMQRASKPPTEAAMLTHTEISLPVAAARLSALHETRWHEARRLMIVTKERFNGSH